jgi:enoyl-CoA hydratase
MKQADDILIERRGALVVVTLNRPRALNALTLAMCRTLSDGLATWSEDERVAAVLIKGAGERAFCAGGDIRWVYDRLQADDFAAAAEFFAVEYPMNARIHHFAKPWIALLDGITMGGGVGISLHGRFRVATERTVFAMPETGIGFFPDVGATFALPRLSGQVGLYLGLTGRRLRAADCAAFGIATHVVPAADQGRIEAALSEIAPGVPAADEAARILSRFAADPGEVPVAASRERIDRLFSAARLEDVVAALEQAGDRFACEVLSELGTKSPTSLKVTFEQLRRGRNLAFDDAMRLEYRLVHRFMQAHDFMEGVRALIVDKDNRPRWQPARLEEVSADTIERYFAPLPQGELMLAHVAGHDRGRTVT